MNRKTTFAALFLVLVFTAAPAIAQTTGFTYQGKFTDNGSPASGNYDFQFKLFNALSGGAQQGTTQSLSNVAVAGGIFTVQLDFGACDSCFNGAPRFLEVAVKKTTDATFVTLAPRQPITATPYAIKTQNLTFNGPFNNGTTIFTTTNTFAGDGAGVNTTPDPSLTSNAGKFNAFYGAGAGQANTTGRFNAFFGPQVGLANTTGSFNAFFGWAAGFQHTTGSFNTFSGLSAGANNTTGNNNTFLGSSAGAFNTTGERNTFIGSRAYFSSTNATGNNNTGLGESSHVTADLANATAIGAFAQVTQSHSLVLGAISDTNGCIAPDCSSVNVGIGTTAPATKLDVRGTGIIRARVDSDINAGIALTLNNQLKWSMATVTGGQFQIFNDAMGSNAVWIDSATNYVGIGTTAPGQRLHVAGDGLFTGNLTVNTLSAAAINAATQFNLAGNRVLSVSGAGSFLNSNTFAGVGAGAATTPDGSGNGSFNSFFGNNAGLNNTTGSGDSFFGWSAGNNNTTGGANAFFGNSAGFSNTTGGSNSFFGNAAGQTNTTGGSNSFFGYQAGVSNTTGQLNSFFGNSTGFNNTTGFGNTFIGEGADFNTTNTTGGNNTLLGASTRVSAGLNNATAIGAFAQVTQSNSLVLGSGVNVGIGTTAPTFKLQVLDPSNTGLRVQTNTAGGTVASFGGVGAFQIDASGVGGGRFQVSENGNVGIGTNAPADKLDVNGVLRLGALGSSGGTTLCRNLSNQISNCSSSLRYKRNIAALHTGLSLIHQLRPVTFDWKQGGEHDLGLVAEEVAKVEPLLVTRNDKGEIEGVKYDRISVVLLNAVKEQQLQIATQQTQNETQRRLIEKQQQQINQQGVQLEALEKLVCRSHRKAKVCK